MKISKSCSCIYTIGLLLCFLMLLPSGMYAQLSSRTQKDSARAQLNHYWFNPEQMFQFQVAYPKLQTIPPLSTDMPYELMKAYIFIDSLLKNLPDQRFLFNTYFRIVRTDNDTVYQSIKYLYKIDNYDPVRFYQYMYGRDRQAYQQDILGIVSLPISFVKYSKLSRAKNHCMLNLIKSDYILKVHINSIESIPQRRYPQGNILDSCFIYRIEATVLDTLKGKVFTNLYYNPAINGVANLNLQQPTICFTNIISNKTKPVFDPKSPMEQEYKPNIIINPGQDLIVSLSHECYYWDYNYDYFVLSLLTATPIINGQVKDNNKEWSDSVLMDYPKWRIEFFKKVDMLLNGKY